ncbi:hypothetical protein MJ904_16665 [Massilia sp. MB5]|uniref:hypothetical protein n=1 Tax=unclassified Massilia TaxID=2609279 RepID=UPI00067CA712|nr:MULTISPECIES: hypothetical protein [unclassified Massilia]UMR28758.1 hypothetical protein MJ904_16665 [Massilia sp. MB5]
MRYLQICAAALAALASLSAHATGYRELPTGGVLRAGDFIETGGEYCVIQQHDSNLVVYKRPRSNTCTGGTPIWASYSSGATFTAIQGDGNLVQYDDAGNPKWSSNTGGRAAGNYTFSVNATTGALSITLWDAEHRHGQEIWTTPADPNPTPQPPNPKPPGPTCPNGATPTIYTVCISPRMQSRMTYKFPACSQREAQTLALQNGWGWGACNPLP